jgi:hypothetical protein
MTFWDWYAIVIAAIFALQFALSYAPPWQRVLVLWIGWFAGGLGIPDALDAKLRRRAAIRSRWGHVGALIGLTAAFIPIRLADTDVGPYLLWVCLGASLVGHGLGAAISSLMLQLRAASDGPRIARTRVVGIHDYIPVAMHILAWVVWATGAGVAVAQTVLGVAAWPSIGIAALAGGSLLVFEISGRALIRRGQPATSTDELVWDDAMRSSLLRDLIQTGVLPVLYGTLLIVEGNQPTHAAAWGDTGLAIVLVAGFAEALIFRLTRGYYLARLWPHARKRTAREEALRNGAATRMAAE